MVHVLLVDVNGDTKGIPAVQNVTLVAMVTIVINHVTGVCLIPVIRTMVSVQIQLDVNLEDSMDSRGSVIKHVYRERLEMVVLELATVSTNHVILHTAHALLVDVNVDIKAIPVAQNVVLVDMASIAINHVMGVYLMHVIKKMAPVIIHQDVNLDGGMDILNVIKYVIQGHLEITALRTATVSAHNNVIK